MAREDRAKEKRQLLISVLLALAALVSIPAATVAWFTIADFTKVHSMSMEITSGTNLRFDLDAHEQFEEYCKVLSFSQIADRRIGKPEDVLAEGQEVEAKIIDVDAENKRISLSIRALLTPAEEEVEE